MPRDSYLSIAGITIALHDDDPRWEWEEPISRFLVSPQPAEVVLNVGRASARPPGPAEARPTLIFDSGAVWQLFREPHGYRIECRSETFGADPYKIATFNEDFTRGTIAVKPEAAYRNPLDYPLDEVLLANLLGRGRGVEIHSCGVIDDRGRGHLFAGVSGAGKTTTARLWDGANRGIVSDDRVIIREQDGAMWMFGTPWHGEAELSMPGGAPLSGVYLLVQSDANELRELDRAEAVARLFRCAFPLFYDAASIDFTLSFLERIAASVPVRELRFTRDRSIVDLVLAA
ncbi:MAG TPA: hypothetical protein VM733_00455 [Thermoanaerobaculia bacterium]|nr:hypothetical protein [Thermoanaerobaculia bacterium]